MNRMLTVVLFVSFVSSALGYYSAEQGRWQTRDPIGEAGGINLHRFLSSNPISLIDLFGLFGNPVPPCAPYPECVRPHRPPREYDPWDDGYSDCFINCMIFGVDTAVGIAQALGASEKAAGAAYHFTDRRFTAWGRSSRVLVPRLAAKFNAIGWGWSACTAWFKCRPACLDAISGRVPSPPQDAPQAPPYYYPGWPGRGHNAPPVVIVQGGL
jgi:hypothetical protein